MEDFHRAFTELSMLGCCWYGVYHLRPGQMSMSAVLRKSFVSGAMLHFGWCTAENQFVYQKSQKVSTAAQSHRVSQSGVFGLHDVPAWLWEVPCPIAKNVQLSTTRRLVACEWPHFQHPQKKTGLLMLQVLRCF